MQRTGRLDLELKILVTVHETLKLENRNWKFGFYAFVLLINVFNFGPRFSTIALYSVTFDLDKTFLLPVCRQPIRKLASSPQFLISSFKP